MLKQGGLLIFLLVVLLMPGYSQNVNTNNTNTNNTNTNNTNTRNVNTRNVNPKTVDVSTLSDPKIRKIMEEIQKRGLTDQQAISLATAYGLSPTQIAQLRQRMQTLEKERIEGTSTNENYPINETDTLQFSEKHILPEIEEEKKVFGFHLFNSNNLTFEPSVNIAVSPSYVVGPGDEIVIDIYGASQEQYVLTVDRNGNITIPNLGPVAVGGLEMAEAEKRIFNKLTLIYRELTSSQPRTFANIQMGKIKAIKVNVIGEVFAPGSYTLPGTATVFNAIYLSGGPNFNGSFRSIKVIRAGKEVEELDVYDYLINGNSNVNAPLRDGDVILIPTYINRVRVGGSFIRTGIFETKNGETVSDLVKYAGGFNEHAYRNRVELHRNDGRELLLKDVGLDSYNQTPVQLGDSLYAGTILTRFANRVSIDGAVFRPGNYELTEGLTLKELIDRADGIREDAFLERGLILRLGEDLSWNNVSFSLPDVMSNKTNILLKREDAVMISPIDSMREFRTVDIHGEVLKPGKFDFREKMTLADIIAIASGFKESASESYIEVTRRLSYDDASTYGAKNSYLYQFSVPRTLALNSKDANFELKAFDQVYVRKAPGFVDGGLVTLSGEVMYSGQYGISSKNERLSDIIKRSGGLTPEAYATGAMLTRKIELTAKARRLREALKESEMGMDYSDLGFEVIGVDLQKAIQNPGGRDDIIMQNGDELVIPRKLFTVNVEGEVLNPITMPFIEGRRLRYYINQGGGFGIKAKRSKAYVVYPNGTASATRNWLFFSSYPDIRPGSQIIVPQRPEREKMPASGWIAIGSGISSLSLTIVSIINATK